MLWETFENKVSSYCWHFWSVLLLAAAVPRKASDVTRRPDRAEFQGWAGPCHWGGGSRPFPPGGQRCSGSPLPSWVGFCCPDLGSHQERSRSYSKVQDNPSGQLLKSYYVPSIVLGPGKPRRDLPPKLSLYSFAGMKECSGTPLLKRERKEERRKKEEKENEEWWEESEKRKRREGDRRREDEGKRV